MTAQQHRRAAPEAAPVLVLDFDGVVCDGFLECALVTWNGHFSRPLAAFGPQGLDQIPETFLEHFRQTRGWARHLGHFLVPLLAGSAELRDQQAFDEAFAGIPEQVVARFTQRVNRYRQAARAAHPQRWLSYHQPYEGVVEALAATGGDFYVVTAKDSSSVLAILTSHQLHLAPDRVYGEQTDKPAALRDIAQRESAEPASVSFVDDSLANVTAARREGFDARWATWGFHADDHVAEARRLAVPSIDLATFASGAPLSPGRALSTRSVRGAA